MIYPHIHVEDPSEIESWLSWLFARPHVGTFPEAKAALEAEII